MFDFFPFTLLSLRQAPKSVTPDDESGGDQQVRGPSRPCFIRPIAESHLPIEIHGGDRSDLEAMGITHGTQLRLVEEVTLPKGWTICLNPETGFRLLLDEQSRRRATMDYEFMLGEMRSAKLWLTRRYAVAHAEHRTANVFQVIVKDTDSGEVLLELPAWHRTADGERYFDARSRLEGEAEAWLNQRFPLWKKPNAYRN